MDKLRPTQHNVLNPYGYRIAALGFMEAMNILAKTYQWWLCPGCGTQNYNGYDPDLDDEPIEYVCLCGWDGIKADLLLGKINE